MANLNFTADSDNALGYNIYRRAGNGETLLASTWVWNQGLTPNLNGSYSYQDTGLTNGVVYQYQVSAEYPEVLRSITGRRRT